MKRPTPSLDDKPKTNAMADQFNTLSSKMESFLSERKSGVDFLKNFIETDFSYIRGVLKEMKDIQDSAKSILEKVNSAKLFG